MKKEQVLNDSKNYLISVHDALRRAFRKALPEFKVSIDAILKSIEQDVKVLETLESNHEIFNKKQERKKEMIEE